MTTLLICLLAGLAVLTWPSGGRRALVTRPPPQASSRSPSGLSASPWWSFGPARRGVRWRRRKDESESDDVADALVLVGLALRAGLPLTAALDHVRAGASGTVRDDLAAVGAGLRWGLPAHEAWTYAGPRWRAAATATHLSEQTGAGAATLLEGAATRMREQGERDRERRAARAGILLVLPLGLGFLPAFACTAVVPVVITLASGVLAGGS